MTEFPGQNAPSFNDFLQKPPIAAICPRLPSPAWLPQPLNPICESAAFTLKIPTRPAFLQIQCLNLPPKSGFLIFLLKMKHQSFSHAKEREQDQYKIYGV